MTLGEIKEAAQIVWEALEPVKVPLDFAFIGVLLTWVFSTLIPGATVTVTLLWSLIRLYETKTVQAWLERRRAAKEYR